MKTPSEKSIGAAVKPRRAPRARCEAGSASDVYAVKLHVPKDGGPPYIMPDGDPLPEAAFNARMMLNGAVLRVSLSRGVETSTATSDIAAKSDPEPVKWIAQDAKHNVKGRTGRPIILDLSAAASILTRYAGQLRSRSSRDRTLAARCAEAEAGAVSAATAAAVAFLARNRAAVKLLSAVAPAGLAYSYHARVTAAGLQVFRESWSVPQDWPAWKIIDASASFRRPIH